MNNNVLLILQHMSMHALAFMSCFFQQCSAWLIQPIFYIIAQSKNKRDATYQKPIGTQVLILHFVYKLFFYFFSIIDGDVNFFSELGHFICMFVFLERIRSSFNHFSSFKRVPCNYITQSAFFLFCYLILTKLFQSFVKVI
jgi:hypothetical protein